MDLTCALSVLRRSLWICGTVSLVLAVAFMPALKLKGEDSSPQVLDLSLLVAPDRPGTWPGGFPYFQINHYLQLGPTSAYNSDILSIDGNTGTQLDVPPHSVPRPSLLQPNGYPSGFMFVDRVPAWQFTGEACVIDVRELLDKSAKGVSSLIMKEHILEWEKNHRPLGPGDVVLFRSDYSDKYYLQGLAGRRYVADPLEGKSPGWPDPHPETMEYLASRGVKTLGTDSASMGPIPEFAEPTHMAGLKHGMIWTEGATNLGSLPAVGAFYCTLSPKQAAVATSEARALAVVGNPLAQQLIDSARKKNVVDLSMTLADNLPVWWPGSGIGRHRQPYLTTNFSYNPVTELYQQTHSMDSHTGTHLVPPSYALPAGEFDRRNYSAEVQQWLSAYEKRYGPRGTSQVTTEQVPLSQTCGWLRLIDVRYLAGKTDRSHWPQSPEITVEDIQQFELKQGSLNPNDIVVFYTQFSDKCNQPLPGGSVCMADPLNGKSEGWPAPGPDAIQYLAKKGIRCVGTDGPALGGTDPQKALMTYWALGSHGMVGVEYLMNLSQIPGKAYFLFAAAKIANCHGGPGRAIALY
ncbi:MAG: cyclase family protein [Terriglobia bacterium]